MIDVTMLDLIYLHMPWLFSGKSFHDDTVANYNMIVDHYFFLFISVQHSHMINEELNMCMWVCACVSKATSSQQINHQALRKVF